MTYCDTVVCDLSFSLRLKRSVDILIFNPPYVVTPPDEMEGNGISISWAGGKDGREVVDRFLPAVDDLLSPTGIFFLVAIEENKPLGIIRSMSSRGFRGEVAWKERCGIEVLYVLCFFRS